MSCDALCVEQGVLRGDRRAVVQLVRGFAGAAAVAAAAAAAAERCVDDSRLLAHLELQDKSETKPFEKLQFKFKHESGLPGCLLH